MQASCCVGRYQGAALLPIVSMLHYPHYYPDVWILIVRYINIVPNIADTIAVFQISVFMLTPGKHTFRQVVRKTDRQTSRKSDKLSHFISHFLQVID